MNKKEIVIGVISIIILGALGWLFTDFITSLLKTLDSSVSASIITAAIGLIGLWYVQWQSKSRDIAESHRSSKIEVYNDLFDILEKFQEEPKGGWSKDSIPKQLKNDFTKLNRGLILWASPTVISAWIDFRNITDSGGNILLSVDTLYKSIRKDLGNSNFNLKRGDLIRIGLSEPNQLEI
mgnify:CR=1 FL=1